MSSSHGDNVFLLAIERKHFLRGPITVVEMLIAGIIVYGGATQLCDNGHKPRVFLHLHWEQKRTLVPVLSTSLSPPPRATYERASKPARISIPTSFNAKLAEFSSLVFYTSPYLLYGCSN